MERWEIKQRLETLEPEEQKKFAKGLIKDLKKVKREAAFSVAQNGFYKTLITAFGLGFIGGATFSAVTGNMEGAAVAFSSVIGVGTSYASSFLADGNFETKIKLDAAKDAKQQIKDLKDMIKQTQKIATSRS